MQAVILAAGTGSRLKHLTRNTTKALIQVGGRPLIQRALAFARAAGCEEFIVVTGAHGEKVKEVALASRLSGLKVVYNPDFLKANLYSLGVARPLITDSFLLLNTDHVYRSGVALRVRAQCRAICALCDADRQLGADDMKVALDERGLLKSISKKLSDFSRGYVGITFCARDYQKDYFEALDAVAAKYGDAAVVEMVLQELADRGKEIIVGDISGIGWLEIDTPEEKEAADKAVNSCPADYPRLEVWK
jgi:choline kinase